MRAATKTTTAAARTTRATDAHDPATTTPPALEYNSRENHSDNNNGGDIPGNASNNIDRISPLQGSTAALARLDIDHLSLLLDGGETLATRTSVTAANSNSNTCTNGDADAIAGTVDGCCSLRQPQLQSQQKRRKHNRTTAAAAAPTGRKRILLRGPSRSGKTSLSMDLAYAQAAANSDCCGGLPCSCIAAIIYRPYDSRRGCCDETNNNYKDGNSNTNTNGRSNNNDNCNYYGQQQEDFIDDDRFPLFCRPLSVEMEMDRDGCNHGDGTSTNKDRYSYFKGRATVEPGKKEGSSLSSSSSSWDPNLLNRIRICRVSSIRDLWWELLVLAGKPPHEQPARAIIVEDLDRIMGLAPAAGDCLSNHRNRNSSYRNRNNNNNGGGDGGNKKNYNNIVATLLKTRECRQKVGLNR